MKYSMASFRLTVLFLLVTTVAQAQKAVPSFVEMITSRGTITVMLYNETPRHKEVFLNMVRSGYYNDALFNRVIKSFVIQGGELDDTIMERESRANKGTGPRIDAELNDSLFHKRGALGAGRNDNPEKKSFINQFYIVEGKRYTDAQLDEVETKRLKGRKIPAWQREIYKSRGGTPFLDHDYTIFGEVVMGIAVVDSISEVKTDKNDLPLEPVKIKMRILGRRESLQLVRSLNYESLTGAPSRTSPQILL